MSFMDDKRKSDEPAKFFVVCNKIVNDIVHEEQYDLLTASCYHSWTSGARFKHVTNITVF